MMRPLASLLLILLACTPAAWADTVNVTTVVDEDNVLNGGVDHGCSLREAVRFMLGTPAERANGYGGCTAVGGASTTTSNGDTINLPAASLLSSTVSVYQLTLGEISIVGNVSIIGTDLTGTAVTDTSAYPVVQAQAAHRIFSLHSLSTATSGSTVAVSDMVLQGCGSACAVNGGIISVDATNTLTLTSTKVTGGSASAYGGAIYMNPDSSLSVQKSDFENNTAVNGAAIAFGVTGLVVTNGLTITASLFTGNVATSTAQPGATVTLAVPVPQYLVDVGGVVTISSSTFSGNTGLALQLAGAPTLRNLTVVENSVGGIDFAGGGNVGLYDSIVAGNPDNLQNPGAGAPNDCLNPAAASAAATYALVAYNVFSSPSCVGVLDPTDVNNNHQIQNSVASNDVLIAGIDPTTKACLPVGYTPTAPLVQASAPGAGLGLLCPLSSPNADTLQFHKPRLLAQFSNVQVNSLYLPNSLAADLALNLLINTGPPGTTSRAACATADQRGSAQRANSCDLGAIALQGTSPVSLGLTTTIGQGVSGDITSLLGDVDLLPSFACQQVKSSSTDDGCYKVLTYPGKGVFVVDPTTHQVVYTPGSDFYGEDTFSFLVATSLSRFSDASSDPQKGQYVEVDVSVQTQPNTSMTSGDTKVGAFGGLPLLGLCGLFAARILRRARNRHARIMI